MQWEGNNRMPTILTFPGTLPGGNDYAGMTSTIDFYATAAAVANTNLPAHCEGKNLLPLLRGDKEPNPDDALFWHSHGSQIARWKQWRIVKFGKEKHWRLYNIKSDPGELSDLANQKVKMMLGSANRLGELVEDLLNVSRIEQGRLSINLEIIQVEPVVEGVMSELQVQADNNPDRP